MKIGKLFSSVLTFIFVLFIIYAIVNIVHFSWMLAGPESFWGFFYFLTVLGIIVTVVVVIIGIIVFMFAGTIFLFSDFPKNITLLNIIKPLGFLLLIVVMVFINTLTGSWMSIYVNKKIADRYSYINKSEKLFDEGKYVKALKYSKKAYEKYGSSSATPPFFILSWLFQKTDYGIKSKITKQYSTTINYAYCLDQNRADLNLAEKLYNGALKLSDTSLFKEEQDYKIFPLLSLANLNLDKGNYAQAEIYFNQLLQLSNKSTKDDVEYVGMAQETFASYYLQVGDFDKARTIRKNNIKLWEEKKQSLKSLQYLFFLLSATSSEIISQNFTEAGKYLIKAKPLAEKRDKSAVYPVFLLMKGIYCNYVSVKGNGNEEIIEKGWLNKIASIFKKSKTSSEKFKAEAEACFLEILSIEKEANGDKSIGYAQGLQRLSYFYLAQNDKIKANQLLKEAVQICEKYKTSNINLYYSILLPYTISEYSLKGYETVKNSCEELENYHFDKLIANYAFLTEKERESYKNLVDKNIALINSIYITTNSDETRKKLYNNIIATKEIALYANENTRSYLGTLNDSLQMEFHTILKRRDSIEIDKNKIEIDNEELSNNILLKEKAIQSKISSMPGFVQFDPRSVKWNNIKDGLTENEIAIEFIHRNIDNTEQYYALVIKKNDVAPELIPLFKEPVLKNLLNQPGNSEERINAIYGKLKDSLYSLIWKPIEGKLTNIQKAYISVSGILYSISFPAMLVDENMDVILLGSTRHIALESENKGRHYSSAVLFGGVNYGKAINGNNKDGNNRGNFINLPFTTREIQEINKIIIVNRPEIKVDLLSEYAASEASFRSLEKEKPDLIHLATHGYYYPGNNFSSSNFLTELYSGTNLSPMLRSGIVLAGANNSSASNTENDGFLSAQEISRLNFANLDLVVLSACETALGETIGSEGVFGLQRAFKLAGAKSLIMSLWKVPDEQTSELMALFYENYMKGMTKSKALKEAQSIMKEKYNDPFNWGGFIVLER